MRLSRFGDLLAATKRLGCQLSERYHEWKLGVSTSQIFMPEDLGYWREGYQMYTSTDYWSFHRVLGHIDVREQDVFLDYGSGLGSQSGIASDGGSGTLFIDDIRLYRP